jgi:serine phosphatase RsbU (regulator of sigma subunit)/anti-sigma regulatory factor (Ser/Thr protein kinase)
VRDRQVGTIILLNARASERADRETLDELALRVSLSVDNARLYERERRLAQILQTALLPTKLPQTPGRAYHAAYVPASNEADVGGDWYDAFPLADGSIALSIGDVAGHGLDAAVIMGEVRQTFRVAAMHMRDPSAVLDLANQLLLARHEPIMVTAIFGIYDGKTFTYGSAGHPPPILATESGDVDRLPTEGLPLGIEPNRTRRAWTITIPPSSLLVLYTDGLIEFTRDVTEGEKLLTQAIRDEVKSHSGNPALSIRHRVLDNRQSSDDVAILTLSVGDCVVKELDLTYSAVPVAASLVRQSISKLAQGLDLSADQTFALQVAVGEAVSNVIEHAYLRTPGSFAVRITLDKEELHVRIEDEGRWRPARQEGRGYGLCIVRSLMSNVEVNLSSGGTTLIFTHNLRDRKKRVHVTRG